MRDISHFILVGRLLEGSLQEAILVCHRKAAVVQKDLELWL